MVNSTSPEPSTSTTTPEQMSQFRNKIIRNPHKSTRQIAASTEMNDQ